MGVSFDVIFHFLIDVLEFFNVVVHVLLKLITGFLDLFHLFKAIDLFLQTLNFDFAVLLLVLQILGRSFWKLVIDGINFFSLFLLAFAKLVQLLLDHI